MVYDPLLRAPRTGGVAKLLPRTLVSNATYSVTFRDFYVAQVGTMSASRVWTLPPASIGAGTTFVFVDESGTVTGGNTIVITAAGSDTINGAATKVINAAYGTAKVVSNGVDAWTVW